MQKFTKEQHQKFKKYFDIQETPSEIDMDFLEKTKKYIRFIKWIPWLKMIAVGNSISMNAGTPESDIDLFIVTTPDTMWINRIVITFIFFLLWVIKTDKKHAGMFCLSFFATTEWMNFKNWKIQDDIYLYFWIVYLKPILSYDNTYEDFLQVNSSWADFSFYQDIIENNKKFIQFFRKSFWDKYKIVDFINNILKKIFLPKTMKHYEKLKKPYGIIIRDDTLKFHNNDIREPIKKELLD